MSELDAKIKRIEELNLEPLDKIQLLSNLAIQKLDIISCGKCNKVLVEVDFNTLRIVEPFYCMECSK